MTLIWLETDYDSCNGTMFMCHAFLDFGRSARFGYLSGEMIRAYGGSKAWLRAMRMACRAPAATPGRTPTDRRDTWECCEADESNKDG